MPKKRPKPAIDSIAAIRRELEAHLRASPFEPFNIRLVDGRELPVPEAHNVWLPGKGPFLAYLDDQGGVRIIRYESVVSLEFAA